MRGRFNAEARRRREAEAPHGRGKAPDVVRRLTGIDDILRHFSFECAVARECDDAVEKGLVESKPFRQRADVPVVLAQRVLEAALLPVDRLRPLRAPLVAEDPPRIGLRLDDEDAVLRHDNMVDRGRRSVRQGKVDVVEDDVLFWKPLSKTFRYRSLPARPFVSRRVHPCDKDSYRKRQREQPPEVDNGSQNDCEILFSVRHELLAQSFTHAPPQEAYRVSVTSIQFHQWASCRIANGFMV